jgi:hypothetical protein
MLSRAAHALAAVQRCAAADMRYSFQRGLRCAVPYAVCQLHAQSPCPCVLSPVAGTQLVLTPSAAVRAVPNALCSAVYGSHRYTCPLMQAVVDAVLASMHHRLRLRAQ